MTREEFDDYWYNLSDKERMTYMNNRFTNPELNDNEEILYVMKSPPNNLSGQTLVVSEGEYDLKFLKEWGYRILKVKVVELIQPGKIKH